MNKKVLFAVLAVVPLVVFSCAKEASLEPQEPEMVGSFIDPWTAIDQSQYVKEYPGNPITVSAGFTETKSHLEISDSYANVLWNAGDSFKMLGYSGGWYGALFSTTGSGAKVDFTSGSGMPSGVKLHSIYAPLCSISQTADPDWGFGLTIPTVQTATADGIQAGLNYAYAQTEDFTDDLHFKNMLSLVRFKMTGAAATSVTSVTLQGAVPLAGDCVMVPDGEGLPQITFSKAFVGDESSSTVTLSGTFAADTWYYFAVAPGSHISCVLSFSDGANVTNKVSSKSVRFNRGRITSLGTIDLGSTLGDPVNMDPIKYVSATAGAPKPVTFAVIPDGFTLAEMPKYEMLAKSAINTIFSVEPFKSYKEYFNVYILKVASNESGANITDGYGTITTARDCYFGSKWGSDSYDDMEADGDKIFDFVSTHCPDIVGGEHPIDEVPVLVIINDTRYGGINWTWPDGKAYCMAPYTYSGGKLGWGYPDQEASSDSDSGYYQNTSDERYAEVGNNVGNWLNTMVHEFGGHCFSRLRDEYWYSPQSFVDSGYSLEDAQAYSIKGTTAHIEGYDYPVPMGLNVSATYTNPGRDDTYGATGWQFLLDQKASLAAINPRYNRIGVYQGGDVSMLNRWRSERVSCMIDNRFYFSTFQRYLIVKRIMTLAGVSLSTDAFDTMFWANDVMEDPVRDIVSSAVMGNSDPVIPRPMPMLPPPRVVIGD